MSQLATPEWMKAPVVDDTPEWMKAPEVGAGPPTPIPAAEPNQYTDALPSAGAGDSATAPPAPASPLAIMESLRGLPNANVYRESPPSQSQAVMREAEPRSNLAAGFQQGLDVALRRDVERGTPATGAGGFVGQMAGGFLGSLSPTSPEFFTNFAGLGLGKAVGGASRLARAAGGALEGGVMAGSLGAGQQASREDWVGDFWGALGRTLAAAGITGGVGASAGGGLGALSRSVHPDVAPPVHPTEPPAPRVEPLEPARAAEPPVVPEPTAALETPLGAATGIGKAPDGVGAPEQGPEVPSAPVPETRYLNRKFVGLPEGTAVTLTGRRTGIAQEEVVARFPDGKEYGIDPAMLRATAERPKLGTLKGLIEKHGRERVAAMLDEWERGAELSPDGTSITSFSDPRNQSGRQRASTRDFLAWVANKEATPNPLPTVEEVASGERAPAPIAPAGAERITGTENPPVRVGSVDLNEAPPVADSTPEPRSVEKGGVQPQAKGQTHTPKSSGTYSPEVAGHAARLLAESKKTITARMLQQETSAKVQDIFATVAKMVEDKRIDPDRLAGPVRKYVLDQSKEKPSARQISEAGPVHEDVREQPRGGQEEVSAQEGRQGVPKPQEEAGVSKGDGDVGGPVAPEHAAAIPDELPGPTSARKAMTADDRAAMGLDEPASPGRHSWEQAIADAHKKRIPGRAMSIAAAVNEKPRALSDTETAGLVLEATRQKNLHRDLMDEIGKATDHAEIAFKSAEAARVEQEFDALTRALQSSGTEKGRALAAQKLTLNKDYELVSVLNRAKSAKGEELTATERKQYEHLAGKLRETTAKVAELETKIAEQSAERVIRQHKASARAREATRHADFGTLLAQVKDLLKAGC